MHEILIEIKFNKETRSIDLLITKKKIQKLCKELDLPNPNLLYCERELRKNESK